MTQLQASLKQLMEEKDSRLSNETINSRAVLERTAGLNRRIEELEGELAHSKVGSHAQLHLFACNARWPFFWRLGVEPLSIYAATSSECSWSKFQLPLKIMQPIYCCSFTASWLTLLSEDTYMDFLLKVFLTEKLSAV